ncbi:MAG: ribosome recycling factor [Gemmataceae bacterium]
MTSNEIMKDAEARMDKAMEILRNELRGLRTGRASPAMLDSLRVEYYGSPTPLKQVAVISAPDPATLAIKPHDPTMLKEIEKAIRSSDLGLAPNNDGKLIRLTIPPMSGEQRKKLSAQVKKSAEAAKVSCRNIRRDGNKQFDTEEKNKAMTEDDRDKGKERMQGLLKKHEDLVDELESKKTKEIMEG